MNNYINRVQQAMLQIQSQSQYAIAVVLAALLLISIVAAPAWSLLFFIALLLVLPIKVEALGELNDHNVGGRFRITWAWTLLTMEAREDNQVTIAVFKRTVYKGSIPRASKDKKAVKKKKRDINGKAMVQHTFDNKAQIIEWVKELVVITELEMALIGSIGFATPDRTAQIAPFLYSLQWHFPRFVLAVEPNWIEPNIHLNGEVRMIIYPSRIIYYFLSLLLNKNHRITLSQFKQLAGGSANGSN